MLCHCGRRVWNESVNQQDHVCCLENVDLVVTKCRLHMQIEDLSAIAEATNNEVTLANLGPRFTDAAAELLEQLPQSHGTGT